MGIYNRSVDLKSEVDYFFRKRVANIFGVDEILQDINKQDFREVFLSNNAERLLFCISGDFAEKAFDRAHHLGLLQESLNTDASREEFRGTVLNYLTNRGNESGKYRQKYIDILNKIQVMQGDGPGVSAQPSFGLKGKAFQELTFDALPLPQQDGQPQEEGSMLTDDNLANDAQKELCRNLKSAIESGSYKTVFGGKLAVDIKAVLGTRIIEDGFEHNFLTYAIKHNSVLAAIDILDSAKSSSLKNLLNDRPMIGTYESEDNLNIAYNMTALEYAREKANEEYEQLIIKYMDYERMPVPARRNLPPLDEGRSASSETGAIPATLPLIPQDGQHQQGRTGGFYSPQTSISSEGSDDEDEHQSLPTTPTFWDKNKGKIAVGTIGASLLIGGIITALVVANPIVVASAIAAAVLGAIMLVGALAKTTDKGKEILAKASDKLSGLFVSNREMRHL